MAWSLEYSADIPRDLKWLDPQVKARIERYLIEQLAKAEDPRSMGEALRGERLGELWKYLVGDWRFIAKIADARLIILVVSICHRRAVYR
jgi:mRNA interferase RelE/StbE